MTSPSSSAPAGSPPRTCSAATDQRPVAVTDLPYFSPPAVEGHAGRVRSVDADGTRVLVFLGRTHLYEEHGVDAVTHGVRTAAAAGCRTVVLTNGCGGLDPSWSPGTPVLIRDHINLTGTSPLHGAHFVDLTDLYSPRLRAVCKEIEPTLAEGVYAQFHGPMYETPAEIGMVRAIGGTLVGMSTALEAIVSRSLGMEVLGLSLVTNLAAGMSGAAAQPRGGPRGGQGRRHAHGRPAREGGPRAMSDVLAQARAWAADDPDEATRAELPTAIAAAERGDAAARAELDDAFAGTLQFGTAGLRGKLGPGSNRMNLVVVARAAGGLARYLNERGGGAVVIGYDARHNSDLFAKATAQILSGAGISAMVLPRPLPTPVLAFAVRASRLRAPA